jgi:hypothetical protein
MAPRIKILGVVLPAVFLLAAWRSNTVRSAEKKLLKDPIFPQMAEESAIEIAKDPEHGPAILYWFKSESGYWAVDNRNHSAFSMCFLSKEECLAYLAANA